MYRHPDLQAVIEQAQAAASVPIQGSIRAYRVVTKPYYAREELKLTLDLQSKDLPISEMELMGLCRAEDRTPSVSSWEKLFSLIQPRGYSFLLALPGYFSSHENVYRLRLEPSLFGQHNIAEGSFTQDHSGLNELLRLLNVEHEGVNGNAPLVRPRQARKVTEREVALALGHTRDLPYEFRVQCPFPNDAFLRIQRNYENPRTHSTPFYSEYRWTTPPSGELVNSIVCKFPVNRRISLSSLQEMVEDVFLRAKFDGDWKFVSR